MRGVGSGRSWAAKVSVTRDGEQFVKVDRKKLNSLFRS
jgi:hypothetical protein